MQNFKLSALFALVLVNVSLVSGRPIVGRQQVGRLIPDGEFCGADVDCISNNCQLVKSLFTCVEPGSKGDGSEIIDTVPTPANNAAAAPEPAANSSEDKKAPLDLSPLPNGEFCGADADCDSQNCQLVKSLFTCVEPGSKGDGSEIIETVPTPANNVAAAAESASSSEAKTAPLDLSPLPNGELCGADADCDSKNCQLVKSLFTCVEPGSKGDGSSI